MEIIDNKYTLSIYLDERDIKTILIGDQEHGMGNRVGYKHNDKIYMIYGKPRKHFTNMRKTIGDRRKNES